MGITLGKHEGHEVGSTLGLQEGQLVPISVGPVLGCSEGADDGDIDGTTVG